MKREYKSERIGVLLQKRFSLVLFVAGMFLFSGSILFAQSPLSKMVGTVKDPGEGVVVGAKVTVRHESTGYTRETVTDESGYFEIDKLPDGPYTLETTMAGFKTFTNRQLMLEARQTMRLDVALQLGEVTESIQVVGETPVVATDTGQITTGHFNRKAAENNYLGQIATLYIANGSMLSPSFQEYQGVGTAAAQNKASVDGTELYNTYINVETVQEIKIIPSGTTAEFANPMMMDFVTQGGTNQFHGKFLMQLGNPALNALGPNTNRRGPGWPTNRDQLWAFSGPVHIPKLYNGKDKTFFYVDREWVSTTTFPVGGAPITIAPEAMRTGDFSFLPSAVFKDGALINPFTRSPFLGNRIPANMINPVAANMQSLLPATNYPGNNPTFDGPNYVQDPTVPSSVSSSSNLTLKFDHQLTSRDRIGYASNWRKSRSSSDQSRIMFFWEKYVDPSESNRVYWTRIFSPNVINELRAGVITMDQYRTNPDPDSPYPTAFSDKFGGSGLQFMKAMGFTWLPNIDNDEVLATVIPLVNVGGTNWQTGANIGYNTGIAFRQGDNFRTVNWHITDNLSWVRGSHSFKMGGEIRPAYNPSRRWGPNVAGRFDFTGRFTGHPYADFLLGLPDNSARGEITQRPYIYQKYGGVFFQDSWRASSKLTLELGLRFEHNGLSYEKNHMMSNFDPVTGSVVVPDEKAKALVSPAYPKNITIKTAAEAGFPLLLRDRPQIHWFPRFGFAYRPFDDSKTVVRGSFGLYSVPPMWDGGGGACCAQVGGALATAAPYALDEAFSNSIVNGVPTFAFPYPFPSGTGSVPGQTALAVNKDFPFAYTQNWTFTVERELMTNTAVRLSYLGTKATNLPYQSWLSPGIGGQSIYPNFSRITAVNAGANMSYQGMEASLKRNFSAGMQFEVFYSWGHKLSPALVLRPWRENDFGDFIEDPRDRDRDRGRAPDWADQRFTISHVIEAPFGRGKRWLSGIPRGLDHVVGGWTFSGFWFWNTWKPMTPVVSGQDPLGLGRNIRAQVVPGCDQNITPTFNKVFNDSCYTRPAVGQYGNAGWNSILPSSWVGLGQNNVAIWKTFNLGFYETARLRIGSKFQNIFNHPYLVAGSNVRVIGTASTARGAMTGSRTIQFEAKIEF